MPHAHRHPYRSRLRTRAAFAALLPAAAMAPAAMAQVYEAPEVVVSATRIETPPEKVGSSVTVIDGRDIERRGKSQLLDALQGVPGVTITRNGGVGATSQIRVRGADPGQTQVLIDGVQVNDPSSNDNSFNFDALLATGIDRIEVLRGPQSALYGNDAMGGVVDIVTSRGRGPLSVTGLAEAGSHHSYRAAAGVSGGTERAGYALNGAYLRTDGISRVADTTEDDGAKQRALTGKAGVDLTGFWTVDVAGGIFDLRSEYDGFGFDAPYFGKHVLRYGKMDNTVSLFGGRMENILSVSVVDTSRSYDEPGGFIPRSNYDGTRSTLEYRANIHVDEDDTLTIGAQRKLETARIVSDYGGGAVVDLDRTVGTNSFYGQYLFGYDDRLFLTFGARHDDNEDFGTENTVRVTAAYLLKESGTTLRGSVGTGAKAPTLYQLYAPYYGNANLRTEQSVGADLGVEQAFWGKRVTAGVTGFWNRFEDLIAFDDTYVNIARARTLGVEVAVAYRPIDALRLTGSYTYLYSEDLDTGRVLPRRPRHAAALGADWQATERLNVGGDLRFVGPQLDSNFSDRDNAAYTVLDANVSYALTDGVAVFGRIENLFNADYQETLQYDAPGRSFFAGVRATF